MATTLYDISVKTSIQMLESSIGLMQKAKDHFGKEKANELLAYQLAADMLPLRFQINSIRHHSLGSLEGMQRGEFNPPPSLPDMDFDAYQSYLEEALATLKATSKDEVNALESKPMMFRMGDKFELPFIAENFAASFSIPNLIFHVTTMYDMFRINGLEIGKTDFLGSPRVGH